MGQRAVRWAVFAATAVLLAAIVPGCGARPAANNGAKLVYSVSVDSGTKRSGLFLVDPDGTHRTRLTPEPQPWAGSLSWSPAGDRILFLNRDWGSGSEIWTINPDGSDPRKIGEWELGASWSPDGHEIDVLQVNGDLTVLSPDGARLRTTDLGTDRDAFPAWSPDRRRFAFTRGDGSIYVALADATGKPRPLTADPDKGVSEFDPVWSPNGKMIAFTRSPSNSSDVAAWTSRLDGSDPRLVASGAHVFAWSPDGTALICSHGPYHPFYAHPLDGSAPRRLSAAEQNRVDARSRFALSPDGKRLVTIDKAGALVVSRADGSEPKRLTDPAEELSPDWSPDGTRVAFLRANELKYEIHTNDVYVIGADGKGERKIVAGIETCRECGTAKWSPDGSALLVWGAFPDGIDVVGLDPVAVKKIAGARSAAWSPDGTTIAFVRATSSYASSSLQTVRRDGTGLRTLAKSALFDTPVWTPDGRSILIEEASFPEGEEVNARVREISVTGAGERTIANDKGFSIESLSVSPNGKTLAFASDDGIEAIELASGRRKVIVPAGQRTPANPAWSPDGKELGYLSYPVEGGSGLYVVRADGSEPRLISKPGDEIASFDWRPATSD